MSKSHGIPYYYMGLQTYRVPLELYKINRQKVVDTFLKEHGNEKGNGILYIEGGKSETRNDSDHEPVFRQESFFHYLTGVREPDCAFLLNLCTGKCTLLIPHLPPDYATVMGTLPTSSEFQKLYGVDNAASMNPEHYDLIKECQSLLKPNINNDDYNENKSWTLYLLKGVNTDSGNNYSPPLSTVQSCIQKHTNDDTGGVNQSSIRTMNIDEETIFPILCECRVTKSTLELDLLRHVTEVTSLAHVYVMKNASVGMMEYQCESLFRHYCYYNFGARHVGYTSICACGPNSAILHYGHAGAPNDRTIKDGDICLFDMGAEYSCYGSDVTCSFPANGKFSQTQKVLYLGVLNAQRAVYAMIKPGVSWRDCHLRAEEEILKALIQLGVVLLPPSMSVKDLVDLRLGAVFMPHGLGHLIGIDTHDVGGYTGIDYDTGDTIKSLPSRSSLPGLKSLRTARILGPNMTLTVEPGCYFIRHLWKAALESQTLTGFLDKEKLEQYQNIGGIRLEDVICVTSDGCENYTICPRTLEEVEHVASGGKWPPTKDSDPTLYRTCLTTTKTISFQNSQAL